MNPALRERLSWRTTTGGATRMPPESATMARTGSYLAGAASALALLSVAAPHGPELKESLLVAVAGAAAVLAFLLLVLYDRTPVWAFHAVAALGTGLATLAVYAWGTESTYGPLPYLWVAVFAFSFFSAPAAMGHLGLMGTAYAAELALESPPDSPVAGWLATVGTLLAAGLAIVVVRHRVLTAIAELGDATRHDELTRMRNRRGFRELFDIELERARRTGAPLSLLVADLDGFERVNDALGRQAGDDALRRVARVVRAEKRSFDTEARIGGEEFAVLVPESDEHGAYVLAERIRVSIERSLARPPAPLTASFGIATFPPHGQTVEGLLHAADQALAAAKRLGGNRSVISSAEVAGVLGRSPRGAPEGRVEVGSLISLAEALDVRDAGSTAHCHRVARFAELMARELALPPEAVERLRVAGILHDVGRVGLPESVLAKAGPLTDAEWGWVRAHPEIGARMLDTTGFADMPAWIRAHHERIDGRGYPQGVSAEELPIEARILAVADAYEAMTSDRPYRPALTPSQAADELRRGSGRQFDAEVVAALLRVL